MGPGTSSGQPSMLGVVVYLTCDYLGGGAQKPPVWGKCAGNFTQSLGGGLIRCLSWQTHSQCGRTLKMPTPKRGSKIPGPMSNVTTQAGR